MRRATTAKSATPPCVFRNAAIVSPQRGIAQLYAALRDKIKKPPPGLNRAAATRAGV
jgi:hypothetical protein